MQKTKSFKNAHSRDSNPQKSFSGHSRKAIRRFKATLRPKFSTQSVKEGEKLSLFHTYHFLTMADANFVVDAFWGTKRNAIAAVVASQLVPFSYF